MRSYIAAFSGSDPNTANELFRGAQVFLKQNSEAEKNIELVKLDNKGEISETIRVISDAKLKSISYFIGIANSDEAIAASKYIEENELLFITPFATNVMVTQCMRHTFRACFDDDQQGKALASFAQNQLKSHKIVVITNESSSYSNGLSKIFIENFKSDRLSQYFYSNSTIESRKKEILTLLKVLKPDLVFIPDHITKASIIAKYLQSELPLIRFLGGDGFGGKKMFLSVVGESNNIVLNYSTHWSSDLNSTLNKTFISNYQKLYVNESPSTGAALSFDSLNIFWSAFKLAPAKDIKSIIKILESKTFNTTMGKVSYSKINHSPSRPVALMEFKNQQYKFLKTLTQ